MKIACYCQHVLGIGHFHRSLEICKALAVHHETVMVLGGPDVTLPKTDVTFVQLPGLKMDANFSTLLPCDPRQSLEEVKAKRQKQLYSFFQEFTPDIFLVELYPFGRKAFRFELDPILQDIGTGKLSPCLRLSSLRDILVEKKDREKYENRVVTLLNTSFDGLLIHSDPDFIPLEQTFSSSSSITIPVHYTGFITPPQNHLQQKDTLRQDLNVPDKDKLIVASIGGGNVGAELLQAVAKAASLLKDKTTLHFHLFTGPYSAPELHTELLSLESPNIHIHRFANNFPEWLRAADLSISMAGYNTCMNLLDANTPALLFPFAQNREQKIRITAFTECCDFTLLASDDLQTEKLAQILSMKLAKSNKQQNTVDLHGAAKSCELISDATLWKRNKS